MIRRIQHFTTQDDPAFTVAGLEPRIPAPRFARRQTEGTGERPGFGARRHFRRRSKPGFGAKMPGAGATSLRRKPFDGGGAAKRGSPFQR